MYSALWVSKLLLYCDVSSEQETVFNHIRSSQTIFHIFKCDNTVYIVKVCEPDRRAKVMLIPVFTELM